MKPRRRVPETIYSTREYRVLDCATLLSAFFLIPHTVVRMPYAASPSTPSILPPHPPSMFFFFNEINGLEGLGDAPHPLANINHKSQALSIMRPVSNDNRRDECVCGSPWHYHIARQECVRARAAKVVRACGCWGMRYRSFFFFSPM